MKILYHYLLQRIILASVAAIGVLTFVLVLGNAFKRVFELLALHDVPLLSVLQMILLLIPQGLTFTIPWGLLIGTLIVFGRFSYDHELQAVYSSGLGLIPLISPVILLSLVVTFFCFLNNAVLAPKTMTAFKQMIIDLARNNPTAILREGEMIDQLKGYRIYIAHKSDNSFSHAHIWQLDNQMLPLRSIRADKGTLSADLERMAITLTLINARQEERGSDLTNLRQIRPGMRAQQLPITVSFSESVDASKIEENITVNTLGRLRDKLFRKNSVGINLIPLLTEFQKRLAFSFAPFTFVLVGIPLALQFSRRETSIGIVLSLAVVLIYYLLVITAMALKERAGAYPELIVWLPNIIFQTVGFLLLWRANHQRH